MRTERFKAALLSILVVASLLAPMLALIGTSEAKVYPDVDNVILRGSEYAYGTEDTIRDHAPPIVKYAEGDFPPIMMAERIGSGAVVAAGLGATCRNGAWNRTGNPDPHLDVLLDIIFQWMVPGASEVLWYEGHNVYNNRSGCSDLISALTTLGYYIDGSTQLISSDLLDLYDILVIPQMQGGTAGTGGEPVLSDEELDAIRNFVEGGQGLLIMDSADWYGHNYYRAQNQVLENLRFCEYENSYFGFQSDMIYDDTNNIGGDVYRPILEIDSSTEIGAEYQSRTGKTTLGVYSPCSMVKIGPSVIITGIPKYRVGMPSDTLEYQLKVTNTSATGDYLTINLQVTDTAGWNPLLDSYSLGVVENGKYEYVKLSVTIPDDAEVGDEDKITVTVTTEEFATLTASFTVTAHTALRIVADEDTFASTQNPDTSMDNDRPNFIDIGRYQTFWSYGYFKWDASLAQIPPDATIIDAKIVLFNYYAYGSSHPAAACELGDDWSEETLTWNNKPENGPIIYSTTIVKGIENDPEPYFWDVTSYFYAQLKGDGVASFCVRPLDNQSENSTRRVESKDIDFTPYWVFEGVRPFLQLHYTVPEIQQWDASITATFSGGSDDAVFGVRPDATPGFDNAYDLPEPPPPVAPPYVRTFFYYPGQTLDELHRSCLAPENLMEWPLRIEYSDSVEDVTLTWEVENIPLEYSAHLYRGENFVADMRAEDNYIFEASTGSYDFKIVVGKVVPFTLELTQGWNMISFPVLPENSSPDSIFGSYYVLYRWDAENKRYVLHADSGSFIEPDPDVEAGAGYWAYVLENENVDMLGVPVNRLTLNLHQGWNLIGPPYCGSSIADPIDDPDNTVLKWAFTWDADQRRYVTTQLLKPGKGYWVYALRNCSLVFLKLKLAIVYDIGGRGDLGFNDMAYMGGKRAQQELSVELVEMHSMTEADYVPNLRAAAEDPDTVLIVGVGYLLSEALAEVAQEFPDKNFMGIDTYARSLTPRPLPNLMDVVFEEHKGSALVGALGALLATHYDYPHIGAVLGTEIPVLWKFEIGYKWGCDWAMSWYENNFPENYAADPDNSIVKTPKKERVLWDYTGTFTDITKGYTAAKPMYDKGAVAVYNIAGPLGLGINQAVNEIAEAENLETGPPFWIGVDADQDWINPGFVIASMMKRVDYGVYHATELVLGNKFRDAVQEYGGVIKLGIGTGVLGIPMEGISVSTLDDLDAFLELGIEAGIIDPNNRDAIYSKVKEMRKAQPSWIWEAVEELENRIRTGVENVPEVDTQGEIDYWRDIFG